jgi:aspartyl-tRNA(Asn)/glutamyl-tRNA(Gln) amidotransferase subunit A
MAETFALLGGVLLVLSVAAIVRVIAARTSEAAYPVLLVVVGVALSVTGLAPDFRLSSDLILMVLVPTVLFQGSQETKSEAFVRVLPVGVLLPIVGLPIAVVLLGVLGSYAFGLPVVVTLLFAVVIYPVDPVAIVALFREADAAERLSILAEVESHFSDGFAVVTCGAMIGSVSQRFETGADLATLLSASDLIDVAVEITVVSFGGVLVGLVTGAIAFFVLRAIDDRMAELLTTVVLAYGSFLLAEHYLHVSGVLATVAAGLVIGIKDNICYKDHEVSAASKILEGFESLYSATAVQRLLEEDAIIIGRLNCDEFAMGSTNENSAFGSVRNPINEEHVPGGSSGGAAAAVRAGLCWGALGSDTGGSVRQPASLTGIVGLKPTYGRISRYGLIAFASSFDQIGVLAQNTPDAGRILEVIAGPDDYDSTTTSAPVPNLSSVSPSKKKHNIAYLTDCLEHDHLQDDIKTATHELIDQLQSAGHQVTGVDFPYIDHVVPTYYILSTAEASSNLARYDGIHYGYRTPNANNLDETYELSRSEGFGKEVKRRIMLGTFVLSAGYYEAYFGKAQKARRLIAEKTGEILEEHDFIVLPTTPSTAPEIGDHTKDPVTMYLSDIFTVQANLSGLPAITVPLSTDSNGLPFGIQLIGNKHCEKQLLSFARQLEQQEVAQAQQ